MMPALCCKSGVYWASEIQLFTVVLQQFDTTESGLGIARDHKKIVTVSSRLDIWIFPAIAERKTAMSAGLDNER